MLSSLWVVILFHPDSKTKMHSSTIFFCVVACLLAVSVTSSPLEGSDKPQSAEGSGSAPQPTAFVGKKDEPQPSQPPTQPDTTAAPAPAASEPAASENEQSEAESEDGGAEVNSSDSQEAPANSASSQEESANSSSSQEQPTNSSEESSEEDENDS